MFPLVTRDHCLRVFGEMEGLTVLDIDYSGDNDFAIWAYAGTDRDLPINETRPCNGRVDPEP